MENVFGAWLLVLSFGLMALLVCVVYESGVFIDLGDIEILMSFIYVNLSAS